MAVNVLFFASLRERLGKQQASVDSDVPISIMEVWERSGGGLILPDNVLVSINHVYATTDTLVQPGDEVAFFPPVTGG
ncbi:MAG: MoaD/ThiS family protein [Thiothrix sp.]|uniref:MoaD/ThiS family protein n=1 Tax=Thiothrix sp. TaxID=1032 RepID=UPI002628422B|nr:MoaD/ThiS family protein [Thiothrix sp.]MDD5395337.1 MoaD/ThiS family protein [Thiothrix sp.]